MQSVTTPREMLTEFVLALFRRKWLILVTFVLLMAGVCCYTYLEYPLHKATALILVHENPRQQLILFHDIATPAQPNYQASPAKNLIEISRSTELAKEIVEEYRLDQRAARRAEDPEGVRETFWYCLHVAKDLPFDLLRLIGILEDSGPKYEYDAICMLLEDRQDIEHVTGTELVKLSVWEEDPAMAAGIANRTAQLLVEKTIALSQTKASTAYAFTKERAEVAGTELQATERELAELKSKQDLVGLETQQQLILARIDRARAEHDNITKQEDSLRSRLVELERQLANVPPQIPASTVVAQNPLVKDLQWSQYLAEMELASRRSTLGEDNPELATLRARAGWADDRLGKQQRTFVQSETTTANPLHQELLGQIVNAEIELKAHAASRTTLEEQIAALEDQLEAMAEKELAVRRLERQKATQEGLYMNLKNKLAELEVQQLNRLSEFDIRLVDAAYLPENADEDWPDWEFNLLIGIPVALAFAVLAALLVNYFDESYVTPGPLESEIGVPVMGCVPEARSGRPRRLVPARG